MANKVEVNITSHADEILKALDTQVTKALTECGMAAETYAKVNCRDDHIVDTGFLRNSITYALSGEGTNTKSYKADRGSRTGSYSGTAPDAGEDKRAVYIGSNVEYAMYVEMGTGSSNVSGGTSKKSWVYKDELDGTWHRAYPQKPRPFIKPAIADHMDKYKEIIKKNLTG